MSGKGCTKTKKGKPRPHTPYTSEAQATAGNIALAVKKGKLPKSKLKGASKQMARGMTLKELEAHSAEAKGKKLPKRAKKTNPSTPKAGTPEGYKAGLSGQKIRSQGKGRGLGRGKGKGPIGVPIGADEGRSYVKERRKQRNRRAG